MVDDTKTNPVQAADGPNQPQDPALTPVPQDPALTPVPQDPTTLHERKHIKSHLKAIGTAAGNIADHVTALRKTGLSPDQTKLVQALHVETAQLHLAVNNAAAIPDEDDDTAENTGGAAKVSVKPLAPADATS